MNWIDLVSKIGLWLLSVLAVYRFAHAMAFETGPWAVFPRIRQWASEKWGEKSWEAEFFTCPLCQSLWYSLICDFILFPGLDWRLYFLLPFAGSGLIVIIHTWLYK